MYSVALTGRRLIYTAANPPAPIAVAAIRASIQVLLLGLALIVDTSINDEEEKLEDEPTMSRTTAIVGSLEIGLYNTLGTLAQTFGLSSISAVRGAFLIQTCIIFTPLLLAIFGSPPPKSGWFACSVALVASLLVTADNTASLPMQDSSTLSIGDLETLFAALCYSMATVRIPAYAQKVPALSLAFGKSAVLATFAFTSILYQLYVPGQGAIAWPAFDFSGSSGFVWALLLWSGTGSGALGSYLMLKGQSLVSATDAQVAFATVPLWSAFLAYFVLHEDIGVSTLLGGVGMITAGILVSRSQPEGEREP